MPHKSVNLLLLLPLLLSLLSCPLALPLSLPPCFIHSHTTVYMNRICIEEGVQCERIPFHFLHASSCFFFVSFVVVGIVCSLFIPFASPSPFVPLSVPALNTYFCHPYLVRDVTCFTITLSVPCAGRGGTGLSVFCSALLYPYFQYHCL